MSETTYIITHELMGDCVPATAAEVRALVRDWNTEDWSYHVYEAGDGLRIYATRNQGSETINAPGNHTHWHETTSEDEFYIVVGEEAS